MAKTAKAPAKSKAPKPKAKAPKKAAPKAPVKAKASAKAKLPAKANPKGKAKPAAKVPTKVAVKPAAKVTGKDIAKPVPKALTKGAPKGPAKPVAEEKVVSKEQATKVVEIIPKAATTIPTDETAAPAVAKKAKKAEKDPLQGLEKVTDPAEKWATLYERAKSLAAEPYKMSGTYEAKTPILHKVLGWGYVMSVLNDRMEVLFKDGIKVLISNYKG
jgi:hypothetical protein